jgi:DNA-3-methyladenine glycosylase I
MTVVALPRCTWCGTDPLYLAYHDTEWGVPSSDDRHLFEMLILEGAQAGLSWITVLRKREHYRAAFANFDPATVAAFGPAQLEALLQNPGLIRNRAKLQSAVRNAQVFLELQARHGSFAQWLWSQVDGQPIVNHWQPGEFPVSTPLSDRLSKELKKAGMNFVGSTILYSYLQAVGVVNDHTPNCYRHAECAALLPQL